MSTIETSRAKQVDVNLHDYDNIPLSMTYVDKTDPGNPLPIDLTDYRFEFVLKKGPTVVKTYLIAAGSLTSTYIQKTGADKNIISFEALWEDVRTLALNAAVATKLVQVVTDTDDKTYVHIVYNIHARQY